MNQNRIGLINMRNAFKNRVSTYSLLNRNHVNTSEFFQDAYTFFAHQTRKLISEYRIIKLNATFEAKYIKHTSNINNESEDESEDLSEDDTIVFNIQTKNIIVDMTSNLSVMYSRDIVGTIEDRIGELQENGSGWTLYEIQSLTVNNNKYECFSGASYLSLPKYVLNKKAVINIVNKDNQCFKWSVLAALYPVQRNVERVSHYKIHENKLNFDDTDFPMTLDQIKIFEKNNLDISINVYQSINL